MWSQLTALVALSLAVMAYMRAPVVIEVRRMEPVAWRTHCVFGALPPDLRSRGAEMRDRGCTSTATLLALSVGGDMDVWLVRRSLRRRLRRFRLAYKTQLDLLDGRPVTLDLRFTIGADGRVSDAVTSPILNRTGLRRPRADVAGTIAEIELPPPVTQNQL